MSRSGRYISASAALGTAAVLWWLTPGKAVLFQAATWQKMAQPGALSSVHAHLENRCASCHTPARGVRPESCIACHAGSESLLQRGTTSFHAGISSCTECHPEHRGRHQHPTRMDHTALTHIGLRQLRSHDVPDSESRQLARRLREWIRRSAADPEAVPHTRITPGEFVLNCRRCHASEDRHLGLFGSDCAECHATDRWRVPEFRHPPASSTDCAQCHQAPPSHYMMHFRMISARVAGKPHARVGQCHLCHRTTSWNDIRGTGWYKHH